MRLGECWQCGAYGEVKPSEIIETGEVGEYCIERISCRIRFDQLVRARNGLPMEVDYAEGYEWE